MNRFSLRCAGAVAALALAACGGSPFGDSGHVSCNDGNKCLPTSQSQFATYCKSVPDKIQVCDCPGGSPGAGCVLSPTRAANVYCCP